MWQILYSAVNVKRVKNSTIKNLLINENLESDPSVMANFLNKFFTNIASKIVSNIEPTDRPPDLNVPFNDNELSFTKNPVTFSEILEACKQLESKTSLDFEGLSLHFVKKVILSIHAPILHVFVFL
jgi:hypothetical protein